MANLRNCPKCGMIFPYQGRNLCKNCLEEEEKEFEKVREYVRKHRGASVIEVSEATEVEEETIVQFLRDGRLESRGLAASIFCERCGRTISSGRLCEQCVKEVDAQIKGLVPQKRSEPEIKIRKTISGKKMYSRENE
jgi:flagellar operon protein (TIGR03826 family)